MSEMLRHLARCARPLLNHATVRDKGGCTQSVLAAIVPLLSVVSRGVV